MRSGLKWAVVAGLLVASGCAARGGDADSWATKTHPDVLAAADLQYYWQARLPLSRGETIVDMYRLDENLYFLTNCNRLVAMDAARGLPLWSFPVAPVGTKVFRACHADRANLTPGPVSIINVLEPEKAQRVEFRPVIINTVNQLFVLDRETGRQMRDIKLDFPANTAGASDGQYFYVGGGDGKAHSVNLQVGQPMWSLNTGAMLVAPVSAWGGRVYIGGTDLNVYVALGATKKAEVNWKQSVGGAVMAPLAVDSRGCFVPCMDKRLYAFDSATGYRRQGWDAPFATGSPLVDGPQLSASSVFQYARADGLHAINIVNGKARWNLPQGRMVLAILDSTVVVLGRDGSLLLTDEIKGTVKTRIPLTGFNRFAANTESPAVFVASRNGLVASIRPLSAGRLTAEMLRPAEQP